MAPVYDNGGDRLTEIYEIPFKLEKEIQKLVEKNTSTIFGIDFVKTEFELNRLRIDSLCFDKKLNAFVIIEYKREQNYSVIDQGATYRNLLLKNPAEFILLCNEIYNKNLKRSDVNWDKTRIIFISPTFTFNQKESYESTDLPIELWTVKQYSNKTVVFEQIQTEEKLKPKDHPSHGTYSEDNHLEKAGDDTKALYAQLRNKILSLSNNVIMDPKQNYIAFIHRVNFVYVIVQKSNLKLTLNMKKGTLTDPKNLARDISNIGHFGNGDYEITIKDSKDLEYILSLISQSYTKN